MDDKHLDRWNAAKQAFARETGREIETFALVMIDTTGEVYYGGSFPSNQVLQRELMVKLDCIRNDLRRFMQQTKQNDPDQPDTTNHSGEPTP